MIAPGDEPGAAECAFRFVGIPRRGRSHRCKPVADGPSTPGDRRPVVRPPARVFQLAVHPEMPSFRSTAIRTGSGAPRQPGTDVGSPAGAARAPAGLSFRQLGIARAVPSVVTVPVWHADCSPGGVLERTFRMDLVSLLLVVVLVASSLGLIALCERL